jgi:xylulokinase
MKIRAPKSGWAEQEPEEWWEHVRHALAEIDREKPGVLSGIQAVGISYQMHGLVLLDQDGKVLRPSIIWCDSRAVKYGEKAFTEIGRQRCLETLLNSPGNFTAAKLAWVKENEPDIFKKIWKIMLPGDYVAYRLTGEAVTTPSGLSEGIFWDYQKNSPADFLIEYFGFSPDLLADVKDTFSVHGKVSAQAAEELGIPTAVPVSYRAGDQPNNAFSLNVLKPGEYATTAGTSGVVYGIVDEPLYDPASRVNAFIHVNHRSSDPRYGVLMCLNGTGILNSWLKHNCVNGRDGGIDYDEMNAVAQEAPLGADGLLVLPYGNGAERTLGNKNPGASFQGINFNIHSRAHMLRAAQEGIVFALYYGIRIMEGMGMELQTFKAGYANMFLSPLFQRIFTAVTGKPLLLYVTDGAAGAARGAGVGAGVYGSFEEAFKALQAKETIEPDPGESKAYRESYESWKAELHRRLSS